MCTFERPDAFLKFIKAYEPAGPTRSRTIFSVAGRLDGSLPLPPTATAELIDCEDVDVGRGDANALTVALVASPDDPPRWAIRANMPVTTAATTTAPAPIQATEIDLSSAFPMSPLSHRHFGEPQFQSR